MKTQELKAQFCKTHFTTMLTFINHCNISNNDFGLACFNDFLSNKGHDYAWNLEEQYKIEEKDLMLGIEEFWTLTERKYGEPRDKMVEYLLKGGAKPAQAKLLRELFDEILIHFGNIQIRELPNRNPMFSTFLMDMRSCLDRHGAGLIKSDKQELIDLFFLYSCICLTAWLRKLWTTDTNHMQAKYGVLAPFEMPSQKIEVCIKKELNDDHTKESLFLFPAKTMSFSMYVQKYKPFTVDVCYGWNGYLKTAVLVEQVLSFFYWQAHLEIIIPKCYDREPLIVNLTEK